LQTSFEDLLRKDGRETIASLFNPSFSFEFDKTENLTDPRAAFLDQKTFSTHQRSKITRDLSSLKAAFPRLGRNQSLRRRKKEKYVKAERGVNQAHQQKVPKAPNSQGRGRVLDFPRRTVGKGKDRREFARDSREGITISTNIDLFSERR